jgi:hypothetical protein
VRAFTSRTNDRPVLGERSPACQCVCSWGRNVRPWAPGEGANDHLVLGERSLPQCLQHYWEHFGERSPKDGRTFASLVCLALLRGLRRTIAQCWANVRFLSVFSTFERTLANDLSVLGERSLPQCANSHCARVN